MGTRRIIITCEHADNYIPKDFKLLFAGYESVLDSHLGWDPGSFTVAKLMVKEFKCPIFFQKISRLLVEVNRSVDHPQLFSKYVQKLDTSVKSMLLEKYYYSYRNSVEDKIAGWIHEGFDVIHISVHSFTPVLNDIERKVEIGLLFDDQRPAELAFNNQWKDLLQEQMPALTIMHNVPYHGADDGFTTYLRKKYTSNYIGTEIEISQKFADTPQLKVISKALADSLSMLTQNESHQV
ncbi:MAG: N-formylglutamate amidohydrolase [Fulvivirga sp.]